MDNQVFRFWNTDLLRQFALSVSGEKLEKFEKSLNSKNIKDSELSSEKVEGLGFLTQSGKVFSQSLQSE